MPVDAGCSRVASPLTRDRFRSGGAERSRTALTRARREMRVRWGSDTGDGPGEGEQEHKNALVDMLMPSRDSRDPALAIEPDAALAADRMVALEHILAGHSAACERAVRIGSKTMDAEDAHMRLLRLWLCHTVDEHVRRKAADGHASATKGMQLVSSLLPAPHESQKTCASVDSVLHIGAASSCPAPVLAPRDVPGSHPAEIRHEQLQWSRFFLKLRAGADESRNPCVVLQGGLGSRAQRTPPRSVYSQRPYITRITYRTCLH